MSTNKVIPPLICPIPRGGTGHYQTMSANSKLRALLKGDSTDDENSFSDLPQPSAYYKLFTRRYKDKNPKHKKARPEYIMLDPSGKFIRRDRTLEEARQHLALDQSSSKNRYGKPVTKMIPVGSYVLKVKQDHRYFNWDIPSIDNQAPVAVKRCEECPNKTSTRGVCACGFWSAIRDATHTKVWWSPHERKMYDILEQKEEKKVKILHIKLRDLL